MEKINKEAESPYRHEEKYLISEQDYHILKNRIKSLLKRDCNTNHLGHYHIRSIYLDDSQGSCLQDSLAGIHSRFKYRIRYYNGDSSLIKFEKKMKENHCNRKLSFRISKQQLDMILKNDYNFLININNSYAFEFYHQLKANHYSPKLVIDYEREAYTFNYNDIRITFDRNISYTSIVNQPHTKWLTPIPNMKHIILELKYYDFIPAYIRRLFNLKTLTRTSLSKYVLCYLSSNGEDLF